MRPHLNFSQQSNSKHLCAHFIINKQLFMDPPMKSLNKNRLKAAVFGVFLGSIASPAFADEACESEITAINSAIEAPAPGVTSGDLEQAQIMLLQVSESCAGGATLASVENEVDAIKHMLRME